MKKFFILCYSIISCSAAFAQIPNMDMESWRHSTASAFGHPTVTVDVPSSWYGSDSLVIALGQSIGAFALGTHDSDWRRQIFEESLIIHGGSHSAKIMTQKEDTFHIAGVISNAVPSVSFTISPPGLTGISLNGGSPVSVKPTSVSAWVRYTVGLARGGVTTDSGRLNVEALSHIGGKDSVIGVGTVSIGADTNWYQVTANLVYSDTTHPIDTIRVAFFSSGGLVALDSSTLYVDDISMTSVPNPVIIDHTGINEISAPGIVSVYPNPATDMLFIEMKQSGQAEFELYTITGRKVAEKHISGSDRLDVSALPAGEYAYVIRDENRNVLQSGKVALSK